MREICPDVPVLADTKTVDGGALEANMVFGAGASFMTVLSCASRATHETVGKCAVAFGASVIVDTITESGKPILLPQDFALPEGFAYVAVHSPTDARLAGVDLTMDDVLGQIAKHVTSRQCRGPGGRRIDQAG